MRSVERKGSGVRGQKNGWICEVFYTLKKPAVSGFFSKRVGFVTKSTLYFFSFPLYNFASYKAQIGNID